MFIHFGLYSIPGGSWNGVPMGRNRLAEWIRKQQGWPSTVGIPREDYDSLLAQFDLRGFDAAAWAREARLAGMGYVVLTAKHHDGFALWDTQVSDYQVVRATPARRDVVAELAAACRAEGLRFGLYYSHWLDWEHPGGGQPPWPEIPGDPTFVQPSQETYEAYWTGKCLPQVEELLVRYRPDLLWFDSWGTRTGHFLTPDRLGRLIGLVRRLAPGCLINSRIGTTEGVDFLSTNDNEFPAVGLGRPWETSGTLNDSWGFHRQDFGWKPVEQLVRHLVDNVSRGGNYQLNVGPGADGAFQPAAVHRLRALGGWLQAHGAALYGTRPSRRPEPAWGRLTESRADDGATVYAVVYEPQADLVVAGPTRLPVSAWILESGEPVVVTSVAEGLRLTLPDRRWGHLPPVVALRFEGHSA
jgi:alpha-L-fucosidase